ncbi:MAG: PfkB family carbohydrate kinase [Rhodovarius sp.]|nr:PfkB family carbohydrate kinase [Rhodovarius sp.]
MPPRVVCCGQALLDHCFYVDEIEQAPSKVTARRYRATVGGMAAHAAIAAARLGARVHFWGRIGEDANGEAVAAALAAEGLELSGLRRIPGARTPLSAVLVDKRGERAIVTWRGEGLSAEADWLPLSTLDGAGAVLSDPRWPEGARTAFTAARSRGVPSVLDAEKSEARLLVELVPLADHVIFAEGGLAVHSPGLPAAEALCRILSRHALASVAVTRGERGVLWLARGMDRPAHLPAFPVEATDTTGAGDVFHGAFAVAIAEGRPVPEALRFAAAAGALRARDGTTPDRAMVDALIGSGT